MAKIDKAMRAEEKALAARFVAGLIRGTERASADYIARQLARLSKLEILDVAIQARNHDEGP